MKVLLRSSILWFCTLLARLRVGLRIQKESKRARVRRATPKSLGCALWIVDCSSGMNEERRNAEANSTTFSIIRGTSSIGDQTDVA